MFKTDKYDKNVVAMNEMAYAELKKGLKGLKNLNFEFEFDPFDSLNVNILDKKRGERLYEKPYQELIDGLEPFKKEYQRYNCLFFYGIGNGIFYKTLLQNAEHKRIVVFEDNIELIYMALNLLDFSEDIFKGRLIILYTKDYALSLANKIFSIPIMKRFFKLYDLHIHSAYYENNYADKIKIVNDANINAIRSTSLKGGNDPGDALMGIEHYMINLPKMLANPTFDELVKKRKRSSNKSKFALLVATGPSLTKQLPLLKKYAKKATIFSADSAYAILHANGIKPDYVLSLERPSKTSELFNYSFGQDYDKDIIFLFYTLTHPNTVKYMEQNKRNFVITQRALSFAAYLNFKECGTITGGMCVMNMAYQLATLFLGFKNVILIGQDLAYANDGKSHPDSYKFAETEKADAQSLSKAMKTTAYGGEGEVYTKGTWTLFREIFEEYFFNDKKTIKTYNCTEGGARIEGSIEKPFKEICENFLAKQPDKKPLPRLKKPSRKESGEKMLRAYKLIKEGQAYTANYIKECKRVQRQLDSLIHGKQKYTLDAINKNLDKIKKNIDRRMSLFYGEILGPTLNQQEGQLAPLYAKNFENETDKQNKLIMWLYSHEAWVEELVDLLEVFAQSMKVHIVPLREELERRGLL